MANRFCSPNQQFVNSAGAPYGGGKLYFYAAGTSTPLATYSDSVLSTANTNPVILGSDGGTGNIFLQNLAYKVILQDSSGNQIWSQDNVWASDFSTNARVKSGAGSPNGAVAGTQGSASVPADVYWDTNANILYVCTTTGSSSTATWTAVNATSAAAIVPPPQGYLTLASSATSPILTADSTAATTVYYTPFVGNLVPIYTGSSFTPTSFTQLSLSLVASHAADTVYDVFVFSNSGVLTLATGPAWTTSTIGSGARGSGAGTTELTRLNGTWVNNVQITGRNGSTTYTIGANLATYLGTIFTDHTAGQVTCHRAWGQNRKFGVWNAYNKQPIMLQAGDSTASWTYASATIRASRAQPAAATALSAFNVGSGTACNGLIVFAGLAEEMLDLRFVEQVSTANSGQGQIYIGWNSITAGSGSLGQVGFNTTGAVVGDCVAVFMQVPTIGANVVACLESTDANSLTFNGANARMVLSASYRG